VRNAEPRLNHHLRNGAPGRQINGDHFPPLIRALLSSDILDEANVLADFPVNIVWFAFGERPLEQRHVRTCSNWLARHLAARVLCRGNDVLQNIRDQGMKRCFSFLTIAGFALSPGCF
jgi:hypothetical protein